MQANTSTPTSSAPSDGGAAGGFRWRTVDIVVVAVLGAAFGVVFWGWNSLYEGVANVIPLPAKAFMYGVWLLPAVLGPLIIRKPGAGIFCELVAASVETLFGSSWGLVTLAYGVLQGMAGEFGFAITAYRIWRRPTALTGGALAGAAAALLDLALYYPSYSTGWQIGYLAIVVVSSALIAGLGGYALTRALAQTGALDPFPSGRERALV
ncbi:ECF transporter S component [Streptomyces sp. SL13]|jgi:energy-coupling factor transport system substrate-specific component|uniref:ECF transporter S component n=1 Tax=Streptantibioticus silvisoli TaxID=2705255 RepID=A0AA90H8R1_9ACTN|nr:ECF transporter S component [Streptantibioticus silvisoli]MDI5965278.1 ECF transporter S component [Streptantibioticus silvisoli]MDI5972938.1 ECF transporter S component [Streptantibioticus silvisoli]